PRARKLLMMLSAAAKVLPLMLASAMMSRASSPDASRIGLDIDANFFWKNRGMPVTLLRFLFPIGTRGSFILTYSESIEVLSNVVSLSCHTRLLRRELIAEALTTFRYTGGTSCASAFARVGCPRSR